MAQQQFELDMNTLIENFDEHPETVREVLPLIRRLVALLTNKGYKVTCDYNEFVLPESITIMEGFASKNSLNFVKERVIERDFRSVCRLMGIERLFN